MNQTIIIGNSISANMAACYLKQTIPELKVTILGEESSKHPIVGESLTEYSTFFFHQIGMGSILEEDHFHKYGLTFYFKQKPNDPEDKKYFMHEAPKIPQMPSNMINRFAFDKQLKARAKKLGVEYIHQKAKEISLKNQEDKKQNHHTITLDSGEKLQASHVIDASGRSRFLAKKLNLKQKADKQRSVFWFRLADFDTSILKKLEKTKKPQYCFNSYYVTHHFLGKHNWIWLIPLNVSKETETKEHKNLISIGIVFRPDLLTDKISNEEEFLTQITKEHPELTKLVNSGKILDTNAYRNYMYGASKLYSKNSWFLLGDAGITVDPLYSTGLVMTSIQITQITEMIKRDLCDSLNNNFVNSLENAFRTTITGLQREISNLYEVMDEPFESHFRVHLSSILYFYFLLPCWLNGYMIKATSCIWITKGLNDGIDAYNSLIELLNKKGSQIKNNQNYTSTNIKNLYFESVNWNVQGPALSQDLATKEIANYLRKLCLLFFKYRFNLLKELRADLSQKDLIKQCKYLLVDAVKIIGLTCFPKILLKG